MPRIYIAGPDVFLPDAAAVLARKKAVCTAHGLEGVTPFDNDAAIDPAGGAAAAQQIYAANRAFMVSCAGCIANATPFRGVSLDPGTAFEIGYMCALGRTVFAYSTDTRLYEARVVAAASEPLVRPHTENGWVTESFGLGENLMVPFGVKESGGAFVADDDADDAALFERCVMMMARTLTA
ncbi:MAG: nucleoside 2-deoxyribosyltransferase [Pseudomonadota bacterium]